jgi:hypothetical protein
MLLRVPVFLVAALRRGVEAIALAVLTEAAVCTLTAGFYAALVQVIRNMQPLWLTATFITLILPALAQLIEYGAHRFVGTPHRVAVVYVSTAISATTALFNWYAMRRGTLLVGNERTPLASDLRNLPRLIGNFLLLPVRIVTRYISGSSRGGHSEHEDSSPYKFLA